jgi:hypothetical protein
MGEVFVAATLRCRGFAWCWGLVFVLSSAILGDLSQIVVSTSVW